MGRFDRFDITAKAESDVGREQTLLMMQALLADRLKLVLHRETKQLPVYTLEVAKDGIRLAASKEGSCITPNSNMTASSQKPSNVCGIRMMSPRNVNGNGCGSDHRCAVTARSGLSRTRAG